jgi:predicted porin
MQGNDTLNRQKAMQGTLTLMYSFSKRTSLYADLVYQKASGSGQAWISMAPGASSGNSQTVANIGVLHAF